MQFLIYVALIGWMPVCLTLFAVLPRRQAILIGVIGAWLFLPPAGLAVAYLPDYTKGSAFCYGITLAMMIFAPDRFVRYRFSWLDLPIICYVVCPVFTSVLNGLGLYDGLSGMNNQLTYWGLPYMIGRLNFEDPKDLRALAVAIVAGGVMYIPICIFEMGVGPILLSKIYGMLLVMEMRLGGFRPRGFLTRGLELGAWMAASSLLGIWLWRSRSLRSLGGLSFGWIVLPALVLTTLAGRSSGSIGLLGLAIAVLWLSRLINVRLVMFLWISAGIIYLGVRVPNAWDYSRLITFLSANFDADRAQSLEFRFQNEDILIAKAVQRPIFGWGGWGRARVTNEEGRDISVTDGLWIITLGNYGLYGIFTWYLAFLGPAYAFVWKYPAKRWAEPLVGPMAAVSALIGLYVIDCLFNGFPNAVYMVAAGALASAVVAHRPDDDLLEAAGRLGIEMGEEGGPGPGPPESAEQRLAGRYVELAKASRLSGDFESAADARRHALELLTVHAGREGEGPAARRRRLDCGNDLAWLLACRPDPAPGDREEAVDLARSAAEADPANPTYWNTLALAFCRAGDDENARDAARRSMELDEAWNGYDMAVLALADARTGRKGEAARWLVEAGRWRDERGVYDATIDGLIRDAAAAMAS